MKDVDFDEFSENLDVLANGFGRRLMPKTPDAYFQALINYELHTVNRAMREALEGTDRFPTAYDLRRMCFTLSGGQQQPPQRPEAGPKEQDVNMQFWREFIELFPAFGSACVGNYPETIGLTQANPYAKAEAKDERLKSERERFRTSRVFELQRLAREARAEDKDPVPF